MGAFVASKKLPNRVTMRLSFDSVFTRRIKWLIEQFWE
jgi:hypothetical protein